MAAAGRYTATVHGEWFSVVAGLEACHAEMHRMGSPKVRGERTAGIAPERTTHSTKYVKLAKTSLVLSTLKHFSKKC